MKKSTRVLIGCATVAVAVPLIVRWWSRRSRCDPMAGGGFRRRVAGEFAGASTPMHAGSFSPDGAPAFEAAVGRGGPRSWRGLYEAWWNDVEPAGNPT